MKKVVLPLMSVALIGCVSLRAAETLVVSSDGITVYDTVNKVNWLADANLAASNRFGLPVCSGSSIDAKTCVNPSGSMSYQAAAAWVKAMNAANYLGHTNWQLPTTPGNDGTCGFIGPHGNSFGFNCMASAFGSLYHTGLGLHAPNTALAGTRTATGPFSNFRAYLYWSQSAAADGSGTASFSFASGFQGANTDPNVLYVLPMIRGKLAGTPAAAGNGLQINPGGQTIYDPVKNVTWLADGNVASTNAFSLPVCLAPGSPKLCVNSDGAMNLDSAHQFIANMNTASYLGQTRWELPLLEPICTGFDCAESPVGELFYGQLGLSAGSSVIAPRTSVVGGFRNLQPYLYWSCEAASIQDPCQIDGPATNFEWSFSFGNGFQGTDILANDLYVTAYFPGAPSTASGAVIAGVSNAASETPVIAANTWVEIRGANLAPAGSRIWKAADFVGNQMPTQLDRVSVTVNGKAAFVYYISPEQINILTPADAMSGPVQVVVNNNGSVSNSFTAQAQALSPSFFVFGGGPYIAATHANGSLIGPATLYPGASTPARPGETVVIYGNGFGPTNSPLQGGSVTQSGAISPLPVFKIGGVTATVQFAGLVAPGEFQFNIVIPASLGSQDHSIAATYNGVSTQAGALINIRN